MLWSVLVQLIFAFWILKKMEDLKKQTAGLQGMSLWKLFFRVSKEEGRCFGSGCLVAVLFGWTQT